MKYPWGIRITAPTFLLRPSFPFFAWQMACLAEYVRVVRRWSQAQLASKRHARTTSMTINHEFEKKSKASSLTHASLRLVWKARCSCHGRANTLLYCAEEDTRFNTTCMEYFIILGTSPKLCRPLLPSWSSAVTKRCGTPLWDGLGVVLRMALKK